MGMPPKKQPGGTFPRDKAKLELALSSAKASLAELKRALVARGASATGIAALARTVASDLGFASYVRWLDLELRGYEEGPLGAVLGVDPADELPKRVASYRRQRGTISIATQTRELEDLPYSLTFPDALSTIEHYAAISQQRGAPGFVTRIATSHIPQTQIRQWLERFGVTELPVTFPGDTHARIVAGFRGEIARIIPELESTIRFNEELMSSEDETPKLPSTQVNTINIHNSPVGNLNLGHQGNVIVDQDVGPGIGAIAKIFEEFEAGVPVEDRDILQDLRRFSEEGLVTEKSTNDVTLMASRVAEAVADKPHLKDTMLKVAKELPKKVGEHIVLAKLSHMAIELAYHLLKVFA